MAKLIMMRGLPGSGKSTKAKKIVEQGEWVRINRDLLREMLHFGKWSGRNEGTVVDVEKVIASLCLAKGISCVVDDTNLSKKHRDMWSEVAKTMDARFEVHEMATDLTTCLYRDEQRDKKVGDHVIKAMALQYSLYPQTKTFLIVDIDGTIANINHRLHFVKDKEEKDWKSFFAEMNKDEPRQDVIQQIYKLCSDNSLEIIYVSGRPDTYRDQTEQWLKEFGLPYFTLLMRGGHDKRPDTEVKQDIYNKYLKHYKIDSVFDDRPSVIRMWKSNGVKVYDVGNGKEF